MVSRLAVISICIIGLLSAIIVGGVYAATLIIYSASNPVTGIVDPTPSPTPTATPSPTPIAGTIALTVNGESTTKTILQGQEFLLVAKLTPASVAQVTFYNNDVVINTVASDESGTATLVLGGLAPGTYVFTAKVLT